MEAVIATAFGQHVNIQRGESDEIADIAKKVFDSSEEGTILDPYLLQIICSKLTTIICQLLLVVCIPNSYIFRIKK